MTIHPKTRDLVRCLLEYEAMEAESSGTTQPTTLRVYEKLRVSLGEVAGGAAFASLASRALALAKPEAPGLEAVQISEDGSLRGLAEMEPPTNMKRSQATDDQPEERGVIFIARLLGLLLIFLGEALTLSLLRVTWPSTVFDDRNSGNGRKA
jgi:hypothetical protein